MFENGATANQVTIFHCWNQTFTVTITNVVIKDLRMTGANPAGFVNAYTGAIDFYNAYNCLVENVNFDNFKSYGIYCYGDSSPYKVSNITIRKCHFDNWVTSTGAAFGAIQFGSKTEFCTAEDNTILCASAFGIASYDGYSGGVSIKHCFLNNRIENQITYGIIFYCTTPNTDTSQIVKGNRIKNIRGSITSGGVKGFGAGIYAVGQKNIMVCDNIVSDTGLDSDTKFASSNITVSRCYGKVIISGNICENGKFGGIELLGNNIDNAKGQFLITNNIVRNSSKDGIYVNEVTDLIVSGNNIYSENIATLSSMNLSTIDYVIITDNTITIISTNTNLYALQLDACKSINISNNFFRTTAVSVYNQIRNVDKGIVSGNMFESNNISKEPIFFEIVTNTRIMGNFVTCPSSVKMGFYGNCAGTFVDKSNRLINASAIINSASGVTIDY